MFIISWCFCIFAKKNRQRIENYLRFIAKTLKTRLNFLLGFSPATKLFNIFSHFRATRKPNWIQFALYGDLMNCAIPDMRRNQDVVLHIFGAGTLSICVYIFLFTRIKTSEKIILLVNPFQTKIFYKYNDIDDVCLGFIYVSKEIEKVWFLLAR